MLAALLLSGVVVAAPVRTPADAEAALAGCSATRVGDEGWDYRCEGVHASAIDQRERLQAEPHFEGSKAAMRAAVGDAGRFDRKRGVVGGHEAEILSLSTSSGTVISTEAFVPLPEGTRSVEVDCIGASPERCRQVLDALAGSPWRSGPVGGGVLLPQPELRLAGRIPTIPEGCTGRPGTSGGQIRCPGPGGGFSAAWGEAPDEATAARAAWEFGKSMARLAPSSVAAEPVSCRIAGVDASCERIVATVPDAPGAAAAATHRFVAMWGWANVAGQPMAAACTGKGSDPVPPPCAAVFELR